jgi:hypothetical protein
MKRSNTFHYNFFFEVRCTEPQKNKEMQKKRKVSSELEYGFSYKQTFSGWVAQ